MIRRRLGTLAVCGVALLWSVTAPCWGFNVKPSTDGTPIPWVQQVGPTCWAATASNILAAAGWGGPKGQPAQVRANNIYQQLLNHWGQQTGWCCDMGVRWWLRKYGCCGNSPYYSITTRKWDDVYCWWENRNDPNSRTYVTGGATLQDYQWLKDELDDCQYVGVAWAFPRFVSGQWECPGHCITLVGADPPLGQSGWHDGNGDWEPPVGSVDTYNNLSVNQGVGTDLPGVQYWELEPLTPGVPGPYFFDGNERAHYFCVLCPGKPDWATEHYDVYWDGTSLENDSLHESGKMRDANDDPEWIVDPDPTVPVKLHVDNLELPGIDKELYIELAFRAPQDPANLPDLEDLIEVYLCGTQYVEPRGGWHWYDDYQTALVKYFFPQPTCEEIWFDPYLFDPTLPICIDTFNVATYCAPEPTTLALVGSGLLILIRRRRRA